MRMERKSFFDALKYMFLGDIAWREYEGKRKVMHIYEYPSGRISLNYGENPFRKSRSSVEASVVQAGIGPAFWPVELSGDSVELKSVDLFANDWIVETTDVSV